MSEEELSALPYRELQKRAKELKVKANQPKDTLIRAILEASSVQSPKTTDLNRTFEISNSSPGLNSTFSLDQPSFSLTPSVKDSSNDRATNENKPPSRVTTPQIRKSGTPLRPAAKYTPSSTALHRVQRGTMSSTFKRKSSFMPKSVLKGVVDLGTPKGAKTAITPGVKFKPSIESSDLSKLTIPSKLPRRKVPDFAKIHEKEFKKMDTLEGYLQKKQERINRVMTPGKSLLQSERTESPRIEAAKKPNEKKIMVKSSTVSDSVNSSLVTTRRQPVLSLSQANFNFGNTSTNKSSVFVFNANPTVTPSKKCVSSNLVGTPGSASKRFDAKASIANKRPLGYQPYTGKLKPWDPKRKLEERKQLAIKSRPSNLNGQMKIRGVRMNRRAELLLKKNLSKK